MKARKGRQFKKSRDERGRESLRDEGRGVGSSGKKLDQERKKACGLSG